jgi:hypothetical protein
MDKPILLAPDGPNRSHRVTQRSTIGATSRMPPVEALLAGTLEAIAGIVVSIVLFVFGYRSTIGARKERIKTARSEIIRVLLRLVAVDGGELTPIILQRTIAGIAAQQGGLCKTLLEEVKPDCGAER